MYPVILDESGWSSIRPAGGSLLFRLLPALYEQTRKQIFSSLDFVK